MFQDKLKQKIKELESEIQQLKIENDSLASIIKDKDTAIELIERMIERGLEWYDYTKLDLAGKTAYWNDAQALLKNPVWQNETNAYITTIIKHIAYETRDHNETMANRTLIVGVEALKERIEAIENPNKEREEEELGEVL